MLRFDIVRGYPCAALRRRLGRHGSALRTALRTALLTGGMVVTATSMTSTNTSMRFGVDVASTSKAIAQGMPMTYGSMWAGAWNQRWGWDGIRSQLSGAKASGVTPVVQWWYWGDDISPNCVEQGCWDQRQGVQKDKATWYRMSNELADLIVATTGSGTGAIVILETEFNKNGIETYEPFDGYLADHARIFHDRGLSVVIGFGNWGQSLWPNFDRAVAAADMLGTMVLQSSVHEASTYLSGADLLINGAQRLQAMFGKPVFVTDFAFSSYPEPSYEFQQDTVVKSILSRMSELKAAGVRGMVWRMFSDDPNFDTSNYHGMAERYWGMLRADGSRKLAFTAFLNGMLAEAAAPTPTPTAPMNLTATAGNGTVTLSWSGVSSATSYNVKSSTTKGGPYQAVAIGVNGTSFVQRGLVNGVTYFFIVSSNTPGGESANSSEASATPTAPPAAAALTVWWPTNGTTISGTQPFKGLLENVPLSTYRMYWQVDNGQRNPMADNLTDYPHKEASVNVAGWAWRGTGPYVLNFVADSASGQLLAQRQVTIYVAR